MSGNTTRKPTRLGSGFGCLLARWPLYLKKRLTKSGSKRSRKNKPDDVNAALFLHYSHLVFTRTTPSVYNLGIVNQREYERLKRKIQAEADEKLRALDIVWSLLNDGAEKKSGASPLESFSGTSQFSSIDASIEAGKNGHPRKRMRVTQEVKRAIPEAENTFDHQDISAIIERRNPGVEVHRGSVSNVLSRLAEREEEVDGYRLELIERGGGSVPNIYKRIKVVQESPDRETGDDGIEENASNNEYATGAHDVIDW
jgi:hypothetical protein